MRGSRTPWRFRHRREPRWRALLRPAREPAVSSRPPSPPKSLRTSAATVQRERKANIARKREKNECGKWWVKEREPRKVVVLKGGERPGIPPSEEDLRPRRITFAKYSKDEETSIRWGSSDLPSENLRFSAEGLCLLSCCVIVQGDSNAASATALRRVAAAVLERCRPAGYDCDGSFHGTQCTWRSDRSYFSS